MSRPFPPPNYEPIESKVKGIEIYRARLPVADEQSREEKQEVVYFRCPQCTAPKAYQIEKGVLHCDYCQYEGGIEAQESEKRETKFEFTTDSILDFSKGWGEERLEMVCQGCNATMSLEANSLTHTCPFCASEKVIRRQDIEEKMHPQHLLPFQVTADVCRDEVRSWLGKSWMVPKSLQKEAFIEEIEPIYLPFWRFSSHLDGEWDAQVGIEEIVTVRDQYGAEYQKMQIVWKRRKGKIVNRLEEAVEIGTSYVSRALFNQVSAYSWFLMVPYQPEYLVGIAAKGYDIPLEKSWEKGRVRIRDRVKRSIKAKLVGEKNSVRSSNLHLQLEVKDAVWHYILLPLYVVSYKYEGKRYQIVMNGESGALAGTRPVNWRLVWLSCTAILIPGVFFTLLGIYIASQEVLVQAIVLFLGVGVIALIFGVINIWQILKQAEEIENE